MQRNFVISGYVSGFATLLAVNLLLCEVLVVRSSLAAGSGLCPESKSVAFACMCVCMRVCVHTCTCMCMHVPLYM